MFSQPYEAGVLQVVPFEGDNGPAVAKMINRWLVENHGSTVVDIIYQCDGSKATAMIVSKIEQHD